MQDSSADPSKIVSMAAAFEGSLALAAVVLGWLIGVQPLSTLNWDSTALLAGMAAAGPLFVLLYLMVQFPVGPLAELTRTVNQLVRQMFAGARLVDMALVALMAGIGEEVLFRGVVQTAAAKWTGSAGAGLLVAGVLFGLLHAISRTYAVVAMVMGIYMGWLWMVTDNLLAPIVTHAVYDLGALWYLRSRNP